jgi:hypothetical protein
MLYTVEHIAAFEDIFAKLRDPGQNPIQRILGMGWQEFQDFVDLVFFCAGYTVENVANRHFPKGPGVDLQLYSDPSKSKKSLVARTEIRRYAPSHLVNASAVAAFWGMNVAAGSKSGYMITTSDFTGPAYNFAETSAVQGKLRLVDKYHLIRYIDYIYGSRHKGKDGFERIPFPIPPDTLFRADLLQKGLMAKVNRPRILVVANNKGGVAKSTTALNLGVYIVTIQTDLPSKVAWKA